MSDGNIENVTKYRRAVSEQESQEQWEEVQGQFHEAIAYFPELAALTDACPACAVAESLSCFPLIVRHFPRSPVATVKMNAVDCYRESALLSLNASDLPPMPPSELEKIKRRLIPGQRFVRALNRLRNCAPTEEELRKCDLKERLPLAIASVLVLRDLIRIPHYYPGAIDEGRAKELHVELVQLLERTMADKGTWRARAFYERPKYGDHSAETNLSIVYGLLAIQHPRFDHRDKSPEHIVKAFFAIAKESLEQISGRLGEVVVELMHIKTYRCQIPRPADDPSFAEKGRFVQMIDRYWTICKKFIACQLDARTDTPDDVTPLMINLRERIEVCFAELGSLDGAADAQQAFSALINVCTSPDRDDLQAASHWTQGEIHRIDAFLAGANTAVKRQAYRLTSEERIFIKHSNRELDKLRPFLDKKSRTPLTNTETMGRQVDRRTDIFESVEADRHLIGLVAEYPMDKRIFLKQGKTWLVVYEGVPRSINDSIGMVYICRLLQSSGQSIHAVALRGVSTGEEDTVILGSAGAMLDRQALREYKKRISDIDGELVDAEADNDLARKDSLNREREKIRKEIARATGLDGRSREALSDRERARQSVSAAIHRALKAIKKEHEPLWQHLKNSLKIGEFLSYQPDQPTSWTS